MLRKNSIFLGGILDNFGHFRKFGKLQISKKKANNDVERGILHICIIEFQRKSKLLTLGGVHLKENLITAFSRLQ